MQRGFEPSKSSLCKRSRDSSWLVSLYFPKGSCGRKVDSIGNKPFEFCAASSEWRMGSARVGSRCWVLAGMGVVVVVCLSWIVWIWEGRRSCKEWEFSVCSGSRSQSSSSQQSVAAAISSRRATCAEAQSTAVYSRTQHGQHPLPHA